ncbi:hypothetical protein CDAR_261711 [Caerostris darwini]|uniref:Uncharacterized protein n=1 Tax=Caerostris darwini TaxID=1538125 RepID=A0AAV4V1I1_9ARAC|nr:hypothetical protein CDAR_261711 [Caerostris darwini]
MDEQNVSEKPIESVADKLLKLEICDKTEENEENNFCLNENDEKDLCDTQVTDKNDEKYEKELDDIDCELCYSNKSRTDLFENITGHDVEIQCTNASNDALNK